MASAWTPTTFALYRHSSVSNLPIDQGGRDNNVMRRTTISTPFSLVNIINAKDLEIARLNHHLTSRAQLAGQLISNLGDEIHRRQAAEKRAQEDQKKYHALRKWFNAAFIPEKPQKEPGLAEELEKAFWPIVTKYKERLESHASEGKTAKKLLVSEGILRCTATRGQMLAKLRILCYAVQILRYNQEVHEEMIEDLQAAEQRLAQRVVDAEEEAERKEAGEGKKYPHQFIKLLETQVRRLEQECAEMKEDYVNLRERCERMEVQDVQLREKVDDSEAERDEILAGHRRFWRGTSGRSRWPLRRLRLVLEGRTASRNEENGGETGFGGGR